jgi:hypothetical protein
VQSVCVFCDSFKGSDLSSLDPKTRKLTPLLNPRRHRWETHFRWKGAYLVGRTPIGRVTPALLHINDELRVELRESLIAEGVFQDAGKLANDVGQWLCHVGTSGPSRKFERATRNHAQFRPVEVPAAPLGLELQSDWLH